MNSKNLKFKVTAILAFLTLQTLFVSAQTLTKLHDFDGTDGQSSYSKLISDGTYLYGMTLLGGVHNYGVIYKVKKDGTGFQKLYDFDDTNGQKPYNSLTLIGSALYGVAYKGGSNNYGTLFKINTDGTNFTKLLDFGSYYLQSPRSSLYFDGTYLYGTTYGGGNQGAGTLYKVKPDGTDFSILYSFNDLAVNPEGDLIFDGTYFYGATYNGNTIDNSTIYKIKADGTGFQKLHDFPDTYSTYNVQASELFLHNGYLYGVTFYSETTQDGYLYKISTDGTNFSVLHNFTQATGNKPQGGLVLAGDYLYGTMTNNGIYRIKPDGTDFANVYTFTTNSGYSSWCGLYFDNTSLYGVTTGGGDNGKGTVFTFNDDNIPLYVGTPTNSETQFSVYPNPAQNTFRISTPLNKEFEVEIYDVSGHLVLQTKTNSDQAINIDNFNSGVYFVRAENETHKLIKK